jgi:hypothetical protein
MAESRPNTTEVYADIETGRQRDRETTRQGEREDFTILN